MTRPARRELANAIRFLAADAVEAAKSGHPGMPMGMADIAEVLWNDHLKHNPANPKWPDRDRFVLSNGHGSMLHYALLHLAGYALSIDDLKRFRQLHSKTAGHPERHLTPGIETTTGPLGQGIANAVGMALGERLLAQRFNRDGHTVVDHHTYVFLGDGCLMEGVSHEVCSLAGTWGLGKLVAFWDDNGISIDGEVQGWFTDDTAKRFESYGWQVIKNVDGHDPEELLQAMSTAKAETQRPTLICCRTHIGFGSPNKQGKESSHGAPLGKDEIALTREALKWPHAPFEIPADLSNAWDARARGAKSEADWNARFAAYKAAHPALAAEFERRMAGDLPADFAKVAHDYVAKLQAEGPVVASRKASQMAIEMFAPLLPELVGGSADLAHSNLTTWKGQKSVTTSDADARYVHYGVREFGMTAIGSGLALHGGFIPFDATFLVFSDYARNAVRMSALLPVRSVHVYTHDSIGLGEDGPTHQPIEHLWSLRLIPNHDVWRPGDAVESAVSWASALQRTDGPSSLVFSRQNLAHQQRDAQQLADIARGGYVLSDPASASFDMILVGTGSELELARLAAVKLAEEGIHARVVSMPCFEAFKRQPLEYREGVLPSWCRKRVVVEAGSSEPWRVIAGLDGAVVGIDRFGESAPGDVLMKHFGFTVDNVVALAKSLR
jgi:transketolase